MARPNDTITIYCDQCEIWIDNHYGTWWHDSRIKRNVCDACFEKNGRQVEDPRQYGYTSDLRPDKSLFQDNTIYGTAGERIEAGNIVTYDPSNGMIFNATNKQGAKDMSEQLKQETEKDIKKLKEELQRKQDILEEMSKEPERWRAGELEYYEYIDSEGNQAIRTDKRSHRDNERHRVGNYFCTGEHSKSSLIRHAHYSQYEKWLPGSDMARPEVTPEGCEFYGTESREWIPSHDPVRLWGAFMIRWPKTSYKGEA